MSDVCEEQKRMIVDMRNEMDKIEVKIQDKDAGAKEWGYADNNYSLGQKVAKSLRSNTIGPN